MESPAQTFSPGGSPRSITSRPPSAARRAFPSDRPHRLSLNPPAEVASFGHALHNNGTMVRPPDGRRGPDPHAEADRMNTPELMGLTFSDAQWRAVAAPVGPLLVLAGPGAGKTRCLTGRIAFLLRDGTDPRRVCALTF